MRTPIITAILATAAIAAAGLGSTALFMSSAAAQGNPAPASGATAELSTVQILQRLEAAGYTAIDEVERDRDEFEVKATDPQGRRVELKIDPVNAQVLKTEFKHDRRSRDTHGSAPQR